MGAIQLQEVIYNIPGALVEFNASVSANAYEILITKLNKISSRKRFSLNTETECYRCGGENYPVLRESQERAVKSDGRAYLVSSSDVGAEYDIHPKSKKELGYRAALLARKYLYGENLTGDAPKLTEARVDAR